LLLLGLMAELILPLFGEGIILLLESLEMAVDTGFELAGLTAEQSQRATAWSGFLVFAVLASWGGYKIRKRYLRMKAAAPGWWEARKQDMRDEWRAMSWKEKLGYSGGVLAMLSLLVLII
jgi:hypothetical protein